ncbi:hypothetical protein HJG53_02175 [Sphingomonas sp. ID1715]|uniref:hypothetical protein n=1 Tax=Sphingomonas sp. ID1715 TaxID=1656898 RepID=UPI001488646D|nr:hypothetical protein [Sphingomonas sp. ID1715]NNM75715.1 hypothetical protein [Sphingomonas sp. ID1715]
MITTAALGVIIAICYGTVGLFQWMHQRQNHTQVSATLIAVTVLGPVLAFAFQAQAWFLTLPLGPAAVGIFLSGYFGRMHSSNKLNPGAKAAAPALPTWAAIPLVLLLMSAMAYSFANGSFDLLIKVIAPIALAIGFLAVGVHNITRKLRGRISG